MEQTAAHLSFKLESFEGPLDLLLHLIDKNKVDIYDIPIAVITDQYLEYIRTMKEVDADRMSEFLVMAATLIDIKAKMLLPKEVDEEGNEEDPRAELVQKLIEYKMYKYMSYELKDREVEAGKVIYKEATIPDEVAQYEAPVDLDAFLEGTTITKLHMIFNDVMARSVERVNLNALNMQSIQREQINITGKEAEIRKYLEENDEFSFRELIGNQRGKMNIIVTFLAVLELIKSGDITAVQSSDGKDILIKKKQAQDDKFDEEFEVPDYYKKKEERRAKKEASKSAAGDGDEITSADGYESNGKTDDAQNKTIEELAEDDFDDDLDDEIIEMSGGSDEISEE